MTNDSRSRNLSLLFIIIVVHGWDYWGESIYPLAMPSIIAITMYLVARCSLPSPLPLLFKTELNDQIPKKYTRHVDSKPRRLVLYGGKIYLLLKINVKVFSEFQPGLWTYNSNSWQGNANNWFGEFDKKKNSHLFPKLYTNSLKPKDFFHQVSCYKISSSLFWLYPTIVRNFLILPISAIHPVAVFLINFF